MSTSAKGKSSPSKGVETPVPKKLKTHAEVLEDFARRGQSIAGWAKKHGFHPQLVSDIVHANPRRKCRIGNSHRIAVLLGLKHGEVVETV